VGSNDLKRVGLIFTEEGAKDFKKTLQDINIEMNKNYNQFKLTQSQWDNSTKSTEKLKAQQEYLTNAYEIQSDKVNVLKMQLADLENAENKNTTAIKKKQNELTNAEIKLKNYESKLKDVQTQLTNTGKKLEEWGEKVEKSGKKIENAGKKLSAFSAASISALTLSAKSAIDFEDAFAGVEKTVDGTKEQMEELKQGIRDMAKEIPSSTTEISAVAEAAGQLGIKTENILDFSKAMIDLGNSTNLTADEAASQLAKFANITQMSQKDFDKLGSTIVDLGNKYATTEADIVSMAMRLAGAGKQVGFSEAEILGLATALSSVGIEAEMGGSAISKAMVKMQNAVEQGGKKLDTVLKKTGMTLRELELMSANDSMGFKELSQSIGMTSTELKQLITAGTNLEDFAKVSGMTTEQFKKAWKEDAAGALSEFIKGLGDAKNKGESAITMLSEMGLTEVRLRDSLLRAANAGTLFNDAINTGTQAWKNNTALTNEANKRYDTLKSKIKIAINKLKDMAITLGNKLMPSIEKVIEGLGKWIDKFSTLSDKQVNMIVKIGLIVAAIGPLVTIIGKVTSVIGGTIKGIGTFTQAIGVARGKITSTSEAVNGLAKVFTVVTSPVGLACTAIGLAVAGIAIAVNESQKKTKEAFENMSEGVSDFYNGLKSAEGYLNSFNTTMFATNEEQQKLQTQMDEVQKGITDICKTASDERRGYTQEEITQLDEYFKKLRELKDREIQIQQQIAGAITQQAVTNAETFQGSLDEYKVQSQEWIATAQKQSEQTKQLIEQGTIEEVALLNQRYGEQATMQNGAYATEYNNIMAQKQAKIDVANEEVAKISEAYANGYLERASQNDGFYTKLQEYNKKIEEENNRHNDVIQNIEDGNFNKILGIKKSKESEAWKHYENQKKIWEEMYKNMSEEQAKELGVWLEQVAQTEMYGGKISDETQKMVNFIMDSYDNMPDDTKKVMKRTMEGMLNGMKDEEPSLFAKAKGIADGILNRLRKAFDIHSPSRKTRAIFKNVMKRNGKRNRNRRK
jgi:TP901 family phage tail tape measure protein